MAVYLSRRFRNRFFFYSTSKKLPMIVYRISLPKTKNPDDFARFMQDEYLPSVETNQTRAGKVRSLSLLKEAGNGHDFLLLVGWSGVSGMELRIDAPEVKEKFASFKAKLKRTGGYEQVAEWVEDHA